MAVPLRDTVFAVAPVGVTLRMEVLLPAVLGRKTTLTTQVAFAAKEVPQLLVWLNCPVGAKAKDEVVNARAAFPSFVSVTVIGELGEPTI